MQCLSKIEGELKGLKDLVSAYPYDEFRNCKLFSKRQREDLLYHRIINLIKEDKTWTIFEGEGDKLFGLLILRKLNWDSEHFGSNMGKIEYIITREDISYEEDVELKAKLISRALRVARENHIQHISCKIDSLDYASLFALQEQGFYIMELLLKFVLVLQNEFTYPNWRLIYRVRKAKSSDLPSLVEIARECFRGSRFHRDPYLSREKASQLFEEWIKNSLSGEMAYEVLVALDAGGRPVGFLTYNFEEDIFRYCGVKAWGRGLQACLPRARGAYVSLLSKAIEEAEKENIKVGFFDVVFDRSLVRIYEKVGMNLIRLTYTLHRGGVR